MLHRKHHIRLPDQSEILVPFPLESPKLLEYPLWDLVEFAAIDSREILDPDKRSAIRMRVGHSTLRAVHYMPISFDVFASAFGVYIYRTLRAIDPNSAAA